jgi:hypothetical protein
VAPGATTRPLLRETIEEQPGRRPVTARSPGRPSRQSPNRRAMMEHAAESTSSSSSRADGMGEAARLVMERRRTWMPRPAGRFTMDEFQASPCLSTEVLGFIKTTIFNDIVFGGGRGLHMKTMPADDLKLLFLEQVEADVKRIQRPDLVEKRRNLEPREHAFISAVKAGMDLGDMSGASSILERCHRSTPKHKWFVILASYYYDMCLGFVKFQNFK